MESSDSNNKDAHSLFLRVSFFSCAKKLETHHNIHIFVSFDVEHNRNLNLKTGTVEGEADMETVSFAFFLLSVKLYMSGWSDVENEQ